MLHRPPHSFLRRAFWASAWVLALAGLVSCGGGGPPTQVTAARVEMTGTVTGGPTTGPGETAINPTARGVEGLPRTGSNPVGALGYALSLNELTGPFALSALARNEPRDDVGVYTVAVGPGVANITPLTTLLMAQLYGEDPAAVFGAWASNAEQSARVTPANLSAAQQATVAFIAEETGYAVSDDVGDFITTPFSPTTGDPMYDAIVGLGAALAAEGGTFSELVTSLAQASRLCLTEKIVITLATGPVDFCPATKSATPRQLDPTRTDFVFTDRRGNILRIAVTGNEVLNTRYLPADGSPFFNCQGANCAGATLGPVAADLSRPVNFSNTSLRNAGGTAALNGSLQSAIPGVVLPVLPCDFNRYTVVLPDRSVIGNCVDEDPFGFGIAATFGSSEGVSPTRDRYDFLNNSVFDPTQPRVSVLLDANQRVLAVEFADTEPDTFEPRRRFICEGEACNGVTLGPVTENTDVFGPFDPVFVRTVQFNDTVLAGYGADGLPTGTTASLRADFTIGYFSLFESTYPPLDACFTEGSATIAAVADDGSAFNACVFSPGAAFTDPETGDVQLFAGFEDRISVTLRNGEVTSATLNLSTVAGTFICQGDCAGIIVSEPDADGRRTLRYENAVLREQFFGPVTGPRSITLTGDGIVFDTAI